MTSSLGLIGWVEGQLFPGMGQTGMTDQVFITEGAKARILHPHTLRSLVLIW